MRATPPSDPAEGLGRMNALGCCESFSMRVLSPRIEPLVRSLEGSIASTASLPPSLSTCRPNTSILVLLPAPGTPVMPMRRELPEWGRHFSMTSPSQGIVLRRKALDQCDGSAECGYIATEDALYKFGCRGQRSAATRYAVGVDYRRLGHTAVNGKTAVLTVVFGMVHFLIRVMLMAQTLHSTPSLVSFTEKPIAARRSRIRSLVAQSLFFFALARISSSRSTASR